MSGVDIDHAWRLAKVKAYLKSRRYFPPGMRAKRKDWAARERLRIFVEYVRP